MKTPSQNSRASMTFNGRVARAPFNAWAESTEGRTVVEQVASTVRFALLGRTRSARRRIWRQLNDAARTKTVIHVVQREADAFLERADPIVYAHDLPRISVDLRRLIAVPRLFVDAEAYRFLYPALRGQPAFASLDGGEALLEWFVLRLVDGMERAAAAAQPSMRNPLHVSSDWMVVGLNEEFEWRVPFEGPPWPGHYYLLELTSSPITRGVRKAADDGIASLEKSLPALTRARRSDILRHAGSSLEQLLVTHRAPAVSF